MASSLLALLDDVATIMRDTAALTKVAAKKTAGVVGDDLALNANQVSGIEPARELPVVWAVAKGSFRNKLILVPLALGLSVWMPWAVTPLLILGGAFLCYEGVEKLAHKFLHTADELEAEHATVIRELSDEPEVELDTYEKDKIRGAVRTDFILSAEIIAITLGTVAASPLMHRLMVLSVISLVMTVGVYGLVAGLVKIDDVGLHLTQRASRAAQKVGHGLLWFAPRMMQVISVVGTLAMFLVGGGILVHGLPPVHHAVEGLVHAVPGPILGAIVENALAAVVGVILGAAVLGLVLLAQRLRPYLPSLKRA